MKEDNSKASRAEQASDSNARKWLSARRKATKAKIIVLLDQKPERMDAVLELLEKDIAPAQKKRQSDDEHFWHTLMRLWELPKRDFWTLLVKEVCKARGWTPKEWTRILAEKTAVQKLSVFLFCVDYNWKIPKPMYNKRFAWDFLINRAGKHNIAARVLAIVLKPDGSVNWDLTGPYNLQPDPAQTRGSDRWGVEAPKVYKSVKHVSGAEAYRGGWGGGARPNTRLHAVVFGFLLDGVFLGQGPRASLGAF